jgi:hypothetical protein
MAIANDRLRLAGSSPASVTAMVPPRPAGAMSGSASDDGIGEMLLLWARTPIGLAFVLTAATLLGYVAMKFLVLYGWAVDWSWLRDNPMLRSGSDNCPNPTACLLAAAAAGGGSVGNGQPRGGRPPAPGAKDPASGGGGNPGPPTYTPSKGSDPLNDPAFKNAQNQYRSNNPPAAPDPPGSGDGINVNHMIQNYFWRQ